MCLSVVLVFVCCLLLFVFFFFKQKTAYEMRISDWSSDVCSSDLQQVAQKVPLALGALQESRLLVGCQAGEKAMQILGHVEDHVAALRAPLLEDLGRSEERRVGKECVSTGRSRWSPDH